MKLFKNPFFYTSLLSLMALGLIIASYVFGWTTPSTTPPGGNVALPWTTSGSDIYYNLGKVGIGTTAPGAKLDVGTAAECCAPVAPTLGLSELTSSNNRLPWLQFHSGGYQEAYIRLASSTRTFEMGDSQGAGVNLALMNAAGTSRNTLISGIGNSYFQGGNVGIGTTGPLSKLSVEGAIFARSGLTDNLILDPQFSQGTTYWGSGGVQEKVVFDTGDIVNSYKIYTTTNVQVYGDYIPVDPYKTYRFSIWIKEDNNDSTLYLGYDAYNSSKTEINSYNSAGTAGSNYYFWNGDLTVNKWRKITGYLFPCNAGTGWTNPADTTSSNYSMDCSTAYLRMRFLNYDGTGYGTGAGTTAWYALPKVEGVQDSLSAFAHNYSDYIINPTTGNVGIGTTGPVVKLEVNGALKFTNVSADTNDGRIGSDLFAEGLNLVGINSDSTYRKINIWGGITQNQNDLGNTWIGNSYFPGSGIWNSSGNVGIGTTAPLSKLSVGGVGVANAGIYGTGSAFGVYGDGGSYGVYGDGSSYGVYGEAAAAGAIGVYGSNMYTSGTGYGVKGYTTGTATAVYGRAAGSGYGVYCNGTLCGGTVAWTPASDIRLKENIVDLPASDGLDAIMRLRPITFHWRDANLDQHKGEQFGLIAQEVQGIFPQLVVPGIASTTITLADGSTQVINNALAMDYSGFVVPIIKAIQEQQQQISPLYYGISIASGFGTSTPFISVNDLGNVGIGTASPKSALHVVGLPVYANNAAAITGGLTAGAFYRTGADPDPVCVVH